MKNDTQEYVRMAALARQTRETDISVTIYLDGAGRSSGIATGIGFFDHMLTALALHSGFGLSVSCAGDTRVDGHHTVEDCGIVLGQALRKALGDAPVRRYGSAEIPMDEACAKCVVDISNRAYLVFGAEFTNERIGEYDTCLTEEFMRAFAQHAGLTLHISAYGSNDHHKTEAVFKALAYALREAVVPVQGVASTKGMV